MLFHLLLCSSMRAPRGNAHIGNRRSTPFRMLFGIDRDLGIFIISSLIHNYALCIIKEGGEGDSKFSKPENRKCVVWIHMGKIIIIHTRASNHHASLPFIQPQQLSTPTPSIPPALPSFPRILQRPRHIGLAIFGPLLGPLLRFLGPRGSL